MAIGICPGDITPFRLDRESLRPAPERQKGETDEALASRAEKISEHNASVRARESAGKVTTWKIRCLSSRDQGRCVSSVGKDGWEFDVVRLGLSGWDAFTVKGQPLAFRGVRANVFGVQREDVIADDVLDQIPYATITELARGIFQLGVTEEELGNS